MTLADFQELDPMSQAEYVRDRKNDTGESTREISVALAVEFEYLHKILNMLRLRPEYQQRLRNGTLTVRGALRVLSRK